jgi:lipoprotein-anchoring transpeptidase ErfK/SrfK
VIPSNRRTFIAGSAAVAVLALAGCSTTTPVEPVASTLPPTPPGVDPNYALMYAAIPGERFPVAAIDLTKVNPAFLRREVAYPTPEKPGTIVVDPAAHYLYHILPGGRAIRYGVGVGKQGFEWNGVATINSKQEWIGQSVSSGCIRMINQDVIDLYNRVPVGTEVKVLPAGAPSVVTAAL